MKIWNADDIHKSIAQGIEASNIDTIINCIARYCDQEAEKSDPITATCYDTLAQALLDALDCLTTPFDHLDNGRHGFTAVRGL